MILEVVLVQRLGGQQIINRWNYTSTGTPLGITNSQALITAMGGVYVGSPTNDFPADTVIKAIALCQSADTEFIEILARNIYPGVDFYELPYASGIAGQVSGASLAPFVAFGLNTTRVTTAIRRGQKRIAGVPASQINDLGVLGTTAQANLANLADHMSEVLTYTEGGNSLSFTPTIVQKKEYTTPSGNKAYEYYPTETEQLAHIAQGFTWNGKATVRSQTSRQYARGA